MKIPPRAPDEVMRLPVLGAFCQTRLSFMRVLTRRLHNEKWRFSRPQWAIDRRGEGVAVYRAETGRRVYSLAVFSRDLPANLRTDRVIAEAWDAAFTLFDGVPSAADIKKMQMQVPLQEAGRNDSRQLVLSRANRSVRAFSAAIETLARGATPADEIAKTGYLMRTTAVYGNGKFGIAERDSICERAEFAAPFAPEMLAVFMFRAFPADLAEHLAAARANTATKFSPAVRRTLGIGNSTGLGMAPFLVNHPILLHHWILARETALARVRSLPAADKESVARFLAVAKKAEEQARLSETDDCGQRQKNMRILKEIRRLRRQWRVADFSVPSPWNAMYEKAAAQMSAEGRETLVSLLLEPHGETIDDLAKTMAADESFLLDGGEPIAKTRRTMKRFYDWAAREDFSAAESRARFWYASAEKQEPRLGERDSEFGADLELPLAIMRDARAFSAALAEEKNPKTPLALFLMRRPQHRGMARRAQMAARFPFGEIRDNLISATMSPLDLLRCKLSFFGASRFDPRSDRWLRINMFRHAPYPHEIAAMPADEWAWESP